MDPSFSSAPSVSAAMSLLPPGLAVQLPPGLSSALPPGLNTFPPGLSALPPGLSAPGAPDIAYTPQQLPLSSVGPVAHGAGAGGNGIVLVSKRRTEPRQSGSSSAPEPFPTTTAAAAATHAPIPAPAPLASAPAPAAGARAQKQGPRSKPLTLSQPPLLPDQPPQDRAPASELATLSLAAPAERAPVVRPPRPPMISQNGEPLHCVVCSEEVVLLAITPCNHSLCHACFLRIHAKLCDADCDICKIDTACGFCRAPYDGAVMTRREAPYGLFATSAMLRDRTLNVYFESKDDLELVHELLRPTCSVCRETFPSLSKLKEHLRKAHDLQLCDICMSHTRKFFSEYKLYTRKDLIAHFRNDPTLNLDNGHPLCQFCDKRMYDNDHLKLHLRTMHVHCGLCDRLGRRNEYCLDRAALLQHYREAHVVCDHPECSDMAFANDIELRGHMAKEHLHGASRAKARQALSVELNLRYEDQGRNVRRSDRGAAPRRDQAPSPPDGQTRAATASLLSEDSSPALPSSRAASANAAAAAAMASNARTASGPGFAAATGAMASTVSSEEHFPPLRPDVVRPTPARTNYNGVVGGPAAATAAAPAASSARPAAAAAAPPATAPKFAKGEYIQLDNAKDRNSTLIREVTRILGRGPALERFKTSSAAFRKGDLSAAEYHQACRALLGDYFVDAFAELITLLPDIAQQRALLAACRAEASATSAWGGASLDLVECECGQVMRRADLPSHARNHADDDTAFPGLPTSAKPRAPSQFSKAGRGGRRW